MSDEHQEQHHERVLGDDFLARQPMDAFREWFDDARDVALIEPDAVTLATVDALGCPDARILLLKAVEEDGLVFYSNYDSAKGQQIASNPNGCLVFWWEPLARQVRIRGEIVRVSPSQSDGYFSRRPRGSRIGAWASPQSEAIGDRKNLESLVSATEERFSGQEIERPENWGGYRLVPDSFEFWQGRRDRLHDRFLFRRDGDRWSAERLAP